MFRWLRRCEPNGVRRYVFFGSFFWLALVLSAGPVQAVLVFVKGEADPIRGHLLRQTEFAVELNQLLDDGRWQERTIARSEIEDMIISVSPKRLESLGPDQATAYCDYAEELSEKRKDPDAQITGIRLYLIAAYLSPERLGRSSLLGAVPLARSTMEANRFRALAYLLDPKHDLAPLRRGRGTEQRPATAVKLTARQVEFVLRALRLLRQGRQREAKQLARRLQMREYLAALTDEISYEEFLEACGPNCPHCERGHVPCPECKGKKMIVGGGLQRVACPTCGARGEVECPLCHGDFRKNTLSYSLMRRIIRLELQWIPGDEEGEPEPATTARRRGWTAADLQAPATTARPLDLRTVTELDPRKCLYRDGRWVTPAEAAR